MDAMENQPITWKVKPNAFAVNCFYTQSFFIVDRYTDLFQNKISQINKSWNICEIEVRQSDIIIYVYQLNV